MIDQEYGKTIKGEDFLLYDHNEADSRILIFATAESLRFLANCAEWYLDGTFQIAPKLFKQLYTIHGIEFKSTIKIFAQVLVFQEDDLDLFFL